MHVCARCLGIYPGIAAGVLASLAAPAAFAHVLLVAVLPLPALVDWALTALVERRGYNAIRTTTGALLGYAYGLGLAYLFGEFDVRILVIGVAYAVAAGTLLSVWTRQ